MARTVFSCVGLIGEGSASKLRKGITHGCECQDVGIRNHFSGCLPQSWYIILFMYCWIRFLRIYIEFCTYVFEVCNLLVMSFCLVYYQDNSGLRMSWKIFTFLQFSGKVCLELVLFPPAFGKIYWWSHLYYNFIYFHVFQVKISTAYSTCLIVIGLFWFSLSSLSVSLKNYVHFIYVVKFICRMLFIISFKML